jgi:hypothetical protein
VLGDCEPPDIRVAIGLSFWVVGERQWSLFWVVRVRERERERES